MILVMFLVFLSILIGANIYLANRFAWYFSVDKTAWMYLLFAGTTIFMIGGVMGATNSITTFGHLFYMLGAIAMGFMLYLLISTLMIDFISLFWKTRPAFYGIASIFIAALISIYGLWNATNLKITEQEIPIAGLENTIRAAHLTDTHLGHFRGGEKLQKIVDEINAQAVDVVFFTGDLLDGKIQLKEESMLPLQNLDTPIYFVEGNHDEYTGVETIKSYLRKIGVNVLQNEVTHFGELQIIGLDFMLADENSSSPHAAAGGMTVKKALETLPIKDNTPTILLHHGPDGIKYANAAGVDLYLAGHTHAGQMWPATYVARMMFEYNRGLHTFKGTSVYVSQGTGTFGPPMRVGTNSELAILNLNPE